MNKILLKIREYWPDILFVSGSVIATYFLLNPGILSGVETVQTPGLLPELPKLPDLPQLPGSSRTIVSGPVIHSDLIVLICVAIASLGLDVLLRKLITQSASRNIIN